MHQEVTAKPSAYAWYVLAIFLIAATLSYTDRQILSLLVDSLRAEMRISDTQVSLLQGAAFATLYAFAGLPLGRWADRSNRRNLIIAAVIIWSLATAAGGFARSYEELFVSRVFVGVGEAALTPAVVSMLGDYFPPHRRATALSVFFVGMIVGAGAAIVVGGALLEMLAAGVVLPGGLELTAWRAVLVAVGLPGVLVALLVLTVREPPRGGDAADIPSLRETIHFFSRRRRLFASLYVGVALINVVDFGVLSWSPAFMMRRYGFTPGEAGAAIGFAAMGAGALGLLAGGLVADRLNRGRSPNAGVLVSFASILLCLPFAMFGLLDSAELSIAMICGYLFFSGAANGTGIAAVQNLVRARLRGTAVAITSFLNILLGLGLGPTLVAAATDNIFRDPSLIGLSIALVAAPLLVASALLMGTAARAAR